MILWKIWEEDSIHKVYTERSKVLSSSTFIKRVESNFALLSPIGKPCEAKTYNAEGYYNNWYTTSDFGNYTINYARDDSATSTLHIILEETSKIMILWKIWEEDSIHKVYTERSKVLSSSTFIKRVESNFALLSPIGKPCEAKTYNAEGYYNNWYTTSDFGNYTINYARAISIILASEETAIIKYQPAYLKTNMNGNDSNTNTMRVIQEQTDGIGLEWKPMKHETFSYVSVEAYISYFSKPSNRTTEGNLGFLSYTRNPCTSITHYANGYYTKIMFVPVQFISYSIDYMSVPRIKNVHIEKVSDTSSLVTWQHEESTCMTNGLTIIFHGQSSSKLEMVIIPSSQSQYHLNSSTTTTTGQREIFILFNVHDNQFSLPTLETDKLPTDSKETPVNKKTDKLPTDSKETPVNKSE
ncbi:unnamed protein product [Schistosoma turkestanicum]|nr:unnamed protein product [Schistosoma turkestanicum]